MIRKLMILAIAALSIGGSVPSHAACATATLHNTLTLNLADGVQVSIVEDSPLIGAVFVFPAEPDVPNSACDDASASETATDGFLSISQHGTELCRNDDVNPSFDPFYFGGGLDDLTGDCGAKFSAASIPNPLLPDVNGTFADPDTGTAYVGTVREVIVDIAGTYKVDGVESVLPQDTTGVSARGVAVVAG